MEEFNQLISNNILDCYRYRADLNGTISQLLKVIPDETYETLKEKLRTYDINTCWCKKFWEKYHNEVVNILNANDKEMNFDDLLLKINFTNDFNPSIFNVEVPNDIEFKKDIAGIWVSLI